MTPVEMLLEDAGFAALNTIITGAALTAGFALLGGIVWGIRHLIDYTLGVIHGRKTSE